LFAVLQASNSENGDDFGYSVSMFGDTIVVGARRDDEADDVMEMVMMMMHWIQEQYMYL
jgi:hypothetical protein